MTQPPSAPDDSDLIGRVWAGDSAAFGELFTRHEAAAHRFARQLVRGPDADDLVSEAFERVLLALQEGRGPSESFLGYLLSTVRRLFLDRVRAGTRYFSSDDMSRFDSVIAFHDTVVAGFERSAMARAFASLPPRWQLVLWQVEVEEQRPAIVAAALGMSANAVSALAYRARERLRQAYLSMHLQESTDEQCRRVREDLGGYVRGGLSQRDALKVSTHLEQCASCAALHVEVVEVNACLAQSIPGPRRGGGRPAAAHPVPVRRPAYACTSAGVPVR